MKKLLLLFAAGIVAGSADAQYKANIPVTAVKERASAVSSAPVLDNSPAAPASNALQPTMKTTAGGSRWYNYPDLLMSFGSDPNTNFGASYMIDKNRSLGYFGASNPLDTVFLKSFGSVLDPANTSAFSFNDPGLVGQIGNQIAIRSTNAYTLDSIRVYGQYMRNPSKTAIVDTLRIAIAYGSNLPVWMTWGQQANFGVDTVRYTTINYDTVKGIGKQAANGPAMVIKDIYLTDASANVVVADPNSPYDGLNVFGTSIAGVSIAANGLVGATVTFISGDNIPDWAVIRTATDVNYNHWRALFFTEKDGATRTYTADDWNVGLSKYNDIHETPGSNIRGIYYTPYNFTSAVWHENPLIDYKLTCPTCDPIINSVNDVNSAITSVNAYPNPANTQVTISYALKSAASASVKITNAVGQVTAAEKITNTNGKVVISTANYASGIYFYTVEANGQKLTNRFVVAH